MKVLFAVSNEEISESIVKRYQKEYKEIISYKNVYYFNAILKELQKDKNYDRIVISEELEAFTNAQYTQIDKFIFDKLDSISDEASNSKGDNIPIILICSDRREKAEEMLVKIFGIGIYDALLGNDRSVDNVCRLLNKPRTKKEAKIYYKIDSEDVSYQAESENDVSEVEIQNILAHYKRLGKDEKRYVDSFDNIASQYNDVQLRIISKFLPLNVRAVLEEKSTKYQQLISYNSKVSDDLRAKNVKKEKQEGTSGKLLNTKNNEMPLSKPVVIPSSVNVNSTTKLAKNKNVPKAVEPVMQEKVRTDVRKIGPMFEETKMKKVQEDTEYLGQSLKQPMTRGEEQINEQPEIQQMQDILEGLAEEPKRKRGRPRKNPLPEENNVELPKRKKGRPRKNPLPEEQTSLELENVEENSISKNGDIDTDDVLLPGFENIDNTENILPGVEDKEDMLSRVEEDDSDSILPGLQDDDMTEDDDEDDANNVLPGLDDEEDILPGLQKNYEGNNSFSQPSSQMPRQTSYMNNFKAQIEQPVSNMADTSYNNWGYQQQTNTLQETSNKYEDVDISNLLTSDKKVACFIGTSKNGTSFIVNNMAEILSGMGINTAILDTTKNRNSYYIYTKNEEELRKTAMESINCLLQGEARGIQVNKNLSVYTSLPDETEGIENAGKILQTLLQRHSLVLIDCDFETPIEYFEKVQEIYLVQSFDILTIQPLTAFLRELKSKDIIKQNKLKIVLNKAVKVRGIDNKTIIGGMAYYNDPAMSFMTELFDKNTIRYITIPFNEDVYTRYLENIINCEVSIKGYPKNMIQIFNELANMIYPLISGKSTYMPPKVERNTFTPSMNSTLDQMKRRY